jgi:hypothetical protein
MNRGFLKKHASSGEEHHATGSVLYMIVGAAVKRN